MRAAATLRSSHVFWLIVLLLVGVSTIAVLSTYRLVTQYSASTRSQQAILEVERFLSDLKDLETSARGYAITSDPYILELFKSAKANVDGRLARLRNLAKSEDVVAARLSDLEGAAAMRVAAAENLIRLTSTRAPQRDIAAAAVAGNAMMDRVRLQAAAIIAAEEREQSRRREVLERQAVITSITLAIGVVISIIVLVWLFGRLSREVARRVKTEKDLRLLNLELEDRVNERTAEVKRARDLLDAVVENLPDMVLLKEPSGDGFRYALINAAGERLLGRDRSEVLGKTEADLFPPQEVDMIIKANKQVLELGRIRTLTDRKLTTATGSRTVETRMVPISGGNGSPNLILAIVRDMTDAKQREEQLRLLQRMDAIGGLTGGLAHDFNNLLAVIMGSVELIQERLDEGSETATLANAALDAAIRGADLVHRLLAFSRQQHLEPVNVDLNERLLGLIPILQRTLGEQIRVQLNSSESLWEARIDPTQVDDALVNLAINARDAMPEGGTLTIETANAVLDEDYASQHVEVEPGEYVMLAVSDTGTGMPADVVERAFEPFFTTKPEGKGTGLGLSQVFGWVKQSAGHIKIYTELGHGTTIKLYLPRSTEDGVLAQEPQAHAEQIGGHETIFVVEDNPNVRRTVRRMLANLGYAIIEAEDAASALEKIRSGAEFDIMLTDVVMPGGMTGYELAAEVETLRPGSKLVFTSGYTELAATGLLAGHRGPLISKPYSKRQLGQAIRAVLDRDTPTQ